MNSETQVKKTVFFLCSPNLGILDNWLPVIWKLKEKRNDLNFIIIFPRPNFFDQINLSNILIILASKIFNKIIFKSYAGNWLFADSFYKMASKPEPKGFEWVLIRIIRKLEKYPITAVVSRVLQFCYRKLSQSWNKQYIYDWRFDDTQKACVLYDTTEELKLYNSEILKYLRTIPKFSILHGINIINGGVTAHKKSDLNCNIRKDIKVYLFSAKENQIYEHEYHIHKSSMEVVGIPRHDPDWMNFLRSKILENSDESDSQKKGGIFIISRPGNTNYHPYKRKKKALEDIKRLAWTDLKKNIVVKLHPKEREEGVYEEVFGTDTYGDKWVYSELHPFVLGKNSTFAISFWSGVVTDMIALGIPTIEYLDLRGIPEFDNNQSLRDKDGQPVLSYRFLELVLGASDYDQMKAHATEIIRNPDLVLSKLQDAYEELFPRFKNINDKIAQDILDISG